MDTTVLLLAVLALVVVVLIWRFGGGRIRANLKGPGETGLDLEGDNRPTPGVRARDLDAKGNLRATEEAGRGVDVERAQAGGDMDIVNRGPSDPKP